jgi:hypothetical protein
VRRVQPAGSQLADLIWHSAKNICIEHGKGVAIACRVLFLGATTPGPGFKNTSGLPLPAVLIPFIPGLQ